MVGERDRGKTELGGSTVRADLQGLQKSKGLGNDIVEFGRRGRSRRKGHYKLSKRVHTPSFVVQPPVLCRWVWNCSVPCRSRGLLGERKGRFGLRMSDDLRGLRRGYHVGTTTSGSRTRTVSLFQIRGCRTWTQFPVESLDFN